MTTTTEPNSICGLPQHLQCYSNPHVFRGGAIQPGDDINIIDMCASDRFLMTLQTFSANDPIHGLLIWDRSQRRLTPHPDADVTVASTPCYLFFGYLCERCHRTFLLPYWVSSADDLPRAVQHSCHGGLDIDEVPRQQIRQAASETGLAIMRQMELRIGTWDNHKLMDHVAHLVAYKLENALESFWQEMVTSATEKAQGRY